MIPRKPSEGLLRPKTDIPSSRMEDFYMPSVPGRGTLPYDIPSLWTLYRPVSPYIYIHHDIMTNTYTQHPIQEHINSCSKHHTASLRELWHPPAASAPPQFYSRVTIHLPNLPSSYLPGRCNRTQSRIFFFENFEVN